jgi:hypothetical protein
MTTTTTSLTKPATRTSIPRMTLRGALECVVRDPGPGANLQYAKSYARVAVQLINAKGSMDEHHVPQLLYVVANLSHWRAPHAKMVKNRLKAEIQRLNERNAS